MQTKQEKCFEHTLYNEDRKQTQRTLSAKKAPFIRNFISAITIATVASTGLSAPPYVFTRADGAASAYCIINGESQQL